VPKPIALLSGALATSLVAAGVGSALEPGETIWTERYFDVSSLASIAHAQDGSFVHISAIESTVLMRWVDGDGELLRTVTFEGRDNIGLEKMTNYPDGGFLITGETGETISGTGEVWVVRTDALGNVLWEREWNHGLRSGRRRRLAAAHL
jgi:hypothetical protein